MSSAVTAVVLYEMIENRNAQKEDWVFECMGLVVLCLIYFTTCVDLYRKLSIFVLDETKKEARLVQL